MSYSQGPEEEHILAAVHHLNHGLRKVEHPRFLDLGAWLPKDKSNTRALFELGWDGVMVEPSPGPMRELIKEYAHVESGAEWRIQLVQAAVVCERDRQVLTLLHVSDDAVSTTEQTEYERWAKVGAFMGELWVPTVTVAELFNQFPGAINFASIDTEGTSVDLLADLMATGSRPECICVEHNGRAIEALGIVQPCGYVAAWGDQLNVVFALKG